MTKIIKLKKGLNIPLKGKPLDFWISSDPVAEVGICPDDFISLTPKPLIKENEKIKAGSPLFFDKDRPEIIISSPVSGTVKQILRGPKRKIEYFIIEADANIEYDDRFSSINFDSLSPEEIKDFLLKSGLWAFLKQRPYNIIPDPNKKPEAIFISAFDTAPLAPDMEIILKDEAKYMQAAINIFKKLIDVPIFVGLKANKNSVFEQMKGININYFGGPHPAGNVGIQIHHIRPINKGEIIWTIRPEDLVIIGKYIINKKYDASRIIAITGSQIKQTGYVKTILGANVNSFLKDENIIDTNNRFITGNVLTGRKIDRNGYLGFFDRMISVIPEGNKYEFLGWALPGFNKFSLSRTFFSWLNKKKEYVIDTNYHGGERAYVVTGQYEQVLPMDIFPQYLVKAAIVKDIDKLEKLGIYEVVEEDMALCEFVCTSKIEVQKIIREALDLIRKEMS